MNNIREYLCREARRITEHSLSYLTNLEEWKRIRSERLGRYLEMMGITEFLPKEERSPLNVTVTSILQRDGYRVEKLYYESLPRLYVSANLYIPEGLKGPAPGVLYVCGHLPRQKFHYQAYPKRFTQLGFVVIIVDTIWEAGEVKGYHLGCKSRGWFHWYSRGYTPGGVELWNGIRALDLLQAQPEVDGKRLGVTGISGGGAMSYWIGAADERVGVVAPVCSTGTVDTHCDCMFQINTYRWDQSDIGALIAPRPLLICSAVRDASYAIESVRECYERLKRIYDLYDALENLRLVETPGEHSYHERSRTTVFSWFLKHLCGRDVPPEKIGDIDNSPEAQEPEKNLLVYVNGPREDEITTTIQDSFCTLADPSVINNIAELEAHRKYIIDTLRQKTFGAFPKKLCELDLCVEMRHAACVRYSFVPEEGWRLMLEFWREENETAPKPVVLMLRSPEEPWWVSGPDERPWWERSPEERRADQGFLKGLPKRYTHALLETRGTNETSWGRDLQWHIRRASALIGRTIASMRVYDVLRCLEVLRGFKAVDKDNITLAGKGEMAVIVLYAALLDGNLQAVILGSPPATQNAPCNPDGTGPAIEMLNCLRFTDLPQVAGLLWPTEIVFIGLRPHEYSWTEDLYARLGKPGAIYHLKYSLNEWRTK